MSRAPALLLVMSAALISSCSVSSPKQKHPGTDPPPVSLPALIASSPAGGDANVPRTAWLVFDFAASVDATAAASIALTCNGATQNVAASVIGDGSRVVVNPASDLPINAVCSATWRGPSAPISLTFETAARGPAATVLYDRNDSSHIEPIPDDSLLVDDSSTRTGFRVQITPPGTGALAATFALAAKPSLTLDGFSPIAPMVVELDRTPDPTTLPLTPSESLDPLATIGLFDVDGTSATVGQRLPFTLKIDDRPSASGAPSHVLMILPAHPLEPTHTYALVILRRALVDPTSPFDPSDYMRSALGGSASTGLASTRATQIVHGVLGTLQNKASPPIYSDDVALLLRITTRSLDDVPNDVLAIRSTVFANPPASFTITDAVPDTDPNVAAMVHGTFEAPLYIDANGAITRDASGKPSALAFETAPFVIALPKAALAGPVPAVMVQHGHPSDAAFIVAQIGRGELAPAGLAAIGFTDIQNRRPALANLEYVFDSLLSKGSIPNYEIQTWADQLAFIRLLPAIEASLDVLPLGADGTPMPDGMLDLDASAPLDFGGFSAGSFHGAGLVAYAPEIRAAALSVGSGHWSGKTMLQSFDAIHDALAAKNPGLTRADGYALFTLGQMAYDAQDPLIHARFARRAPVLSAKGPSLLMTEGIGDTLVPVEATRGGAWQFGLPQLGRVAVPIPFLDVTQGPLSANLDSTTTGAFIQFVPVGIDGIAPTPACAEAGETVGHYCADISKGIAEVRVPFFMSALTDSAPTIEVPDN